MSKKVYIVFSGSPVKCWNYCYDKRVFKNTPSAVFISSNKAISLKYRDKLRSEGKRSFIKTRCVYNLVFD